MSQLLRAILFPLVLSVMAFPTVLAQEIEPPTDSAAESSTTSEAESAARPLEQITVIGEQSFYSLRLEIESAEEEVFGIFNELNSSDEMDIHCTHEVYTGSHMKVRDCMPGFLREAIAQNAQDYVNGIDVQLTRAQMTGEVHQEQVALEAEMIRLAQENAELYQALHKLTELTRKLQIKKSQSFSFFK